MVFEAIRRALPRGRERQMLLAAASAAAMAFAFSDAAYAQTDTDQVETVVVTAQKHAENVQNVPISITAISAESALRQGVNTTDDLAIVTPALNLTHVSQTPLVFIRGVGTQNSTTGEEGSNPIYVDGFYNPSLAGSLLALNNIERVEVLKGPQGTLFGRNATGGAINIITRTPSDTPSLSASIGYGNYNTATGSFYGTTGITDNLAADIAVYENYQGDGWGKNLYNGKTANYSREFAGRSKWLFTPDASTNITFAADYERTSTDIGFAWRPVQGAYTPILLQTLHGYYNTDLNVPPTGVTTQWGVSLRADRDFDWFQLVSMTEFRHETNPYDFDQDASSLPLVNAIFSPQRSHVFTQELQIQSLPNSKISWIGGLFYLDEDAFSELTLSGLAFAPLGGVDTRLGDIRSHSVAGYAQTTIPIGWNTDLTVGGRYTEDRKHYVATETNALFTLPNDIHKKWPKLTWRFALDHHFTDDIMGYLSASRGYKAGSFSIVAPSADPTKAGVNPETLTAYEAGLKTEFFDHRLLVNSALFTYQYKNIQLNQIISGTQFLLNAASAKISGLDFDLTTVPIDNLTLTAGFSALFRHSYGKFPGTPETTPNPINFGGNTSFTEDTDGNTMILSPNWDVTLGASYDIPLNGDGDLELSTNYLYNSGFYWEPGNRVKQNAYGLVNAQAAWTLPDDRWRIRVWGKNLASTKYLIFFSSSVSDTGAPAAPRTYGIAVDLNL
jgi:iron complex outermembrane receptor protein